MDKNTGQFAMDTALPRYISCDTVKPGDMVDVYQMGLLFGTIKVAEIRVSEDGAEVVDTRGRHFGASDYVFDIPAHIIDEDEQSIVGATLYHKDTGKKLTVKYNAYRFVKCTHEDGSTALYVPDELTARANPLTALKNDLKAAVDGSCTVRAWLKEDSDCDEYDVKAVLADILKRIESAE